MPAEDGTETCFVLGNVCFSQVMDKVRQKKVRGLSLLIKDLVSFYFFSVIFQISVDCECDDDCIYSRYTLSLTDQTILERTSTDVHFKVT